jgi:hypothetical protein
MSPIRVIQKVPTDVRYKANVPVNWTSDETSGVRPPCGLPPCSA